MTRVFSNTAHPEAATRLALIILFTGAFAIGFSPIFVRASESGPIATAFWRMFFSLPILWAFFLIEVRQHPEKPTPRNIKDLVPFLITGSFLAFDLSLWHWSIRLTTITNSTVLANMTPVFIAIGGWILFRDKIGLLFIGGILFSITGSIMMTGKSLEIGTQNVWGDVFALLTAIVYSGFLLGLKHLRQKYSTATIMAWVAAVTSTLLLPVAFFSHDLFLPVTGFGWLMVLGLALVSHVTGGSCVAYSLAHLPAAFISLALLLQPIIASIFAWFLFKEHIQPLQGLGSILVLAGISIARMDHPKPANQTPVS